MDGFGNPSDRDIHGNTPADAWGAHPDTNVHGNPPTDGWGHYSPDGGGSIWDLFFG